MKKISGSFGIKEICFTDRLVAAYFVYNAISVIWLIKGGFPFGAYIRDFLVFLLPVLFYFAGRAVCADKAEKLLRYFMIAAFMVGVICMLTSVAGTIGMRSERWIAAVNNMYSTWLGNGLGANGKGALGFEDAHVITDSDLVKMYCEQGIIGFSMFLYILILSFKKSFRELKEYRVELGIIAAALILSIGVRIFTFPPAAIAFWFAVGAVFRSSDTEIGKAKVEV